MTKQLAKSSTSHFELSGLIPMLPTPFDSEGRIIFDDFSPVIDFQLENGADGISALGLGGEASRLSVGEREAITDRVIALVRGRAPVVIGVGADDSPTACRLAAHASACGAHALMVAPPNLKDLSRDTLRQHFLFVSEAAGDTHVMIQDAPAFMNIGLGPTLLTELQSARKNIRYIKSESIPGAEAIADLKARFGHKTPIFGGAAGLHLLDMIDAGAAGIIPGSEAPAEFKAIWSSARSGDTTAAREKFSRLQPLLVFESQSLDIFLACSKAILKARGLLRSDAIRGADPLGAWSRQALARHMARAFPQLAPITGAQ